MAIIVDHRRHENEKYWKKYKCEMTYDTFIKFCREIANGNVSMDYRNPKVGLRLKDLEGYEPLLYSQDQGDTADITITVHYRTPNRYGHYTLRRLPNGEELIGDINRARTTYLISWGFEEI